jgi:hypothetical protein
MADRHPQPEPMVASRSARITPSASPEETAAIMAAIEQFRRASSSSAASTPTDTDRWLRAAILEGVSRDMHREAPDPWRNT